MKSEFTGRHMTAILVGGFGIVVAVNFFMASLATNGFGGVVVENSYVASQKFNGWLDEAQRQRELGWKADVERDAKGRLAVQTQGVPEEIAVTASLRRPLGQPEPFDAEMVRSDSGKYVSTRPLPQGRWLVRLTIASGERRYRLEEEVR